MKITENELIDALRNASRRTADNPDGAMTSHEMGEALGLSHRTIIEYLRKFKRTGRLEIVRVSREGIDGRVSPVTGYRVKKTPKKRA